MLRFLSWPGLLLVAITVMAAGSASRAGPAVNQFEVKDLQSSPGDFEFQSQNAFSTGQPNRRSALSPSGETLYDDNSIARQREAMEIQLGITDWLRFRIGIEYEQERLDDPATFTQANAFGDLDLTELALEGVVVLVKPKAEGVGLGLLVEYGNPVAGNVEDQAELYFGPIIEAHTGPWSLIANLALVKFIGGKSATGDPAYARDEKWDFSYFLQGKYRFSDNWALALETYGTIDRVGNTGTASEAALAFGDMNQYRAGAVAYYTFFPNGRAANGEHRGASKLSSDDDADDKELSVTIGAGVLFSLNENTPDTTWKLSVEVDY